MITKKEIVLTTGNEYRFKTKPVDPYDPFVGKYIVLSYDIDRFNTTDGENYVEGQKIYVYLGTDNEGYAKVEQVSTKADPASGDYVEARVDNFYDNTLHINYPFTRFYMNEYKAQPAEDAYNQANQWGTDDRIEAYALVRVKKGEAVLENVYINQTPIDVYLKEHERIQREKQADTEKEEDRLPETSEEAAEQAPKQ